MSIFDSISENKKKHIGIESLPTRHPLPLFSVKNFSSFDLVLIKECKPQMVNVWWITISQTFFASNRPRYVGNASTTSCLCVCVCVWYVGLFVGYPNRHLSLLSWAVLRQGVTGGLTRLSLLSDMRSISIIKLLPQSLRQTLFLPLKVRSNFRRTWSVDIAFDGLFGLLQYKVMRDV